MVRDAQPDDLDGLAVLFDAYRSFYGREGDLEGARRFVGDRLAGGETRFFVAVADARLCAFVHLLPAFDTLAMRPMWILEDLFVEPAARRGGIGGALLVYAEAFARLSGAARLTVSTAHTNHAAQRLYARHGWVLDQDFRYYHRMLS